MFSICIPAYNAINTIERCVDSALNQTFRDFNIIIVDDGSEDGCYDFICRKYSSNNKIKIIRNNMNRGSLFAKVKSIVNSDGKYVVVLDSDDTLESNALSTLNDLYSNKGQIDIVQFWINCQSKRHFDYFNNKSETFTSNEQVVKHYVGGIFPKSGVLCHNMIAKSYYGDLARQISNLIVELMGDDIRICMADDLIVNSMIGLNSNNAKIIENRLYNYSIGGMSTGPQGNVHDYLNDDNILKLIERIKKTSDKYDICCDKITNFLASKQVDSIYLDSDGFRFITDEIKNRIVKFQNIFDKDIVRQYIFNKTGNSIEKIIKYLPILIRKPKSRKIKKIGIHFSDLNGTGGCQTFIEFIIKLFKRTGYEVVLILETKSVEVKIDISNCPIFVVQNSSNLIERINSLKT